MTEQVIRLELFNSLLTSVLLTLMSNGVISSVNQLYGNRGFPGGSVVKNPSANTGDVSLIPGLGRSPGEENGNPLQYSCLENPMDRGAWWAIVHGVTKESNTT